MNLPCSGVPVGLRLSELSLPNSLPLFCSELEGRLTHLVKNKKHCYLNFNGFVSHCCRQWFICIPNSTLTANVAVLEAIPPEKQYLPSLCLALLGAGSTPVLALQVQGSAGVEKGKAGSAARMVLEKARAGMESGNADEEGFNLCWERQGLKCWGWG